MPPLFIFQTNFFFKSISNIGKQKDQLDLIEVEKTRARQNTMSYYETIQYSGDFKLGLCNQ